MTRRTGPTAAVRSVVFERDRSCVLCGDPGQDVQHRRCRGTGGSRRESTNRPGNLVLLCRPCHQHVEAYPREALDRGLRVPQSVEDPSSCPVVWHGRTVLLLDDGTVQDVTPEWTTPAWEVPAPDEECPCPPLFRDVAYCPDCPLRTEP